MSDKKRETPINLSGEEFRKLGHALVDRIAEFYDSLPERPVTRAPTPQEVRALLGDSALPETGTDAARLLDRITPVSYTHLTLPTNREV